MVNLKNIALALHNYHNDYGCFPPAYVADKNGRPMHSWRTLILPYLERRDIYDAYDFNEPWDGPNNIKLSDISFDYYHCPANKENGKAVTNYVAVVGSGTVWSGERGTKIEAITDGTNNTILLVELADTDIGWTEPRDITLEEAMGKCAVDEVSVPSSKHHTEATYLFKSLPIAGCIAMADGSVRILHKRPSAEDLAALLSINGGESVDMDRLARDIDYPLVQRLRWDHVIGLPLFLIAVVWFWYRLLRKRVDCGD